MRAQILSTTYVWLDCFSCPQQQPAAAAKPGEEAAPAPTPLPDLSVRRRTVDDAIRQCRWVGSRQVPSWRFCVGYWYWDGCHVA